MKQFDISGMSCAACSARVEKAVSSIDGVEKCSVNLLTNSMSVEGSVSDEVIISAVVNAGYGAALKGEKTKENVDNKQNTEEKKVLKRLILSLTLLLPLMYISMGHVMWGAPLPSILADSPLVIALLQMIISGAVLVINQKFFISGFKAIINLSPNMDTL